MAINPFGDLTYARPANVYAGLPLDRIKETADILQDKYNTATNNANQIEIGLASMELDKKDEPIRQEATQTLSLLLNPIRETGNWEDAAYVVQKGAKDVAANKGLLAATKNYQGKLAQDAALQKRADDQKILQRDVEFEKAQAEARHTGVKQNPLTGAWEGFYQVETPPDYIDVGEYTNKFLAGFKADEWFGQFQRDANGKWMRAKLEPGQYIENGEVYSKDGTYSGKVSTEEATYDEVYLAAREQVLQNNDIKERLDYEIKQTNPTFESKLAIDPNARLAMEADLARLNYEPAKIRQMSDDELTKVHAREDIIHTGIDGSVLKHSYAKETVSNWNLTYKAQQNLIMLKAAASGGGNAETVKVEQNFMQFKSGLYTPNALSKTVEEFNTQIADMEHQLDLTNSTVELKHQNLQAALQSGVGIEAAKVALSDATIEAERKAADLRDFQKMYKQAAYAVGVDAAAEYERLDALNASIENLYDADQLTRVSAIHNLAKKINPNLTDYDIITMGSANLKGVFSTWMPGGQQDLNPDKVNGAALLKDNEILIDSYGSKKKEAAYIKENLDAKISAEFEKQNANKSVEYAYVDISQTLNKDGTTTSTNFGTAATKMFRDQYGSNFRVVREDGNTVGWAKTTGDLEAVDATPEKKPYKPENISILGPTTDAIVGLGYCFYAVEELVDSDNKKTGDKRNLIVHQTSGTSMLELAMFELRTGVSVKDDMMKGTGEKGLETTNDYVYKMTYQEIDKQLAKFQHFPPIPPKGKSKESVGVEVTISADKRAKVTRNVYPDGSQDWDVAVWEVGKNSKSSETNPTTNKGYNDRFDVELALETYAGYGDANGRYSVNMGTLVEVAENELPYGKIDRNMQSMPRLKNEFKNAFIDMTNQIGKSVGNYSYNVTSMTRSKALNSSPDVNGDPNSGHLYGEGIDISLNSADGKKMLAWMNANSDGTPLTEADLSDPAKLKGYRRINGLPITWEAHDRGSGMHLDIKWAGGTK